MSFHRSSEGIESVQMMRSTKFKTHPAWLMKKMQTDCLPSTKPAPFVSGAHRGVSGSRLIEAISLTAEVCGQALSPAVVRMLADDLGNFNEDAILAALTRCRMELQSPLKMADILARIDDGRPDAEEAWTMMPESELTSVVWTDEMARAWGIAFPLLSAGDAAGARAAFLDAYTKAVLEARIRQEPAHWTPSLGSDVAGRARVLLDAVQKGRLSAAHVEQLLPPMTVSVGAEKIIAQVKIRNLH
jgi:hypothetical protein